MIRRPPRSTLFPYHDALPISSFPYARWTSENAGIIRNVYPLAGASAVTRSRSEEHTSELQSRLHLVCRLLLEKKKNKTIYSRSCKSINNRLLTYLSY